MEEAEDWDSPQQLSAQSQSLLDPSVVLEETPTTIQVSCSSESGRNGNKKTNTGKVNHVVAFTGIFMTYWPSIGVSPQQRILFTISMSMLNVGQIEMLGKLETDTTNVITEIGRLSHLKNQWSTTSQVQFITFSFTIGSINLGLSNIGQ